MEAALRRLQGFFFFEQAGGMVQLTRTNLIFSSKITPKSSVLYWLKEMIKELEAGWKLIESKTYFSSEKVNKIAAEAEKFSMYI